MPHYVYACNDCSVSYEKSVEEGVENSTEAYEASVLFETSHRMNPTQAELDLALVCPRCKSTNATRTMHGAGFTTYVRGYGWLDKNGVARDMHTHKLMNDDPYAQYRQSGETNQIKETLQKKGKKQVNPQYFTNRVSSSDVEKAVYNKNDG